MTQITDVLIIGGGLAGLVTALDLSRRGLKVILVEKNDYPRHKVCGEYISNEVLPYLRSLDADPLPLGAKRIGRFQLSTAREHTVETKLPLGGFGISRHTLDFYFCRKAQKNGALLVKDTVVDISFRDDQFFVGTKGGQTLKAAIAIGAFGKRSNIDMHLQRGFIQQKAPFLAVKSHYRGAAFPDDLVSLHLFGGGYCGVSKVENDLLNICYLTSYAAFQQYKNVAEFQTQVLHQNEHLRRILEQAVPVFQQALTIGQVSFLPKAIVEHHVLMCGDAAGMIHPLCGNGMAMAILSAQLVSKLIEQYVAGRISSREKLEQAYAKQWQQLFRRRLWAGRLYERFFRREQLLNTAIKGLKYAPGLLTFLIAQTHGGQQQSSP